jgi:hypothetical protein
MPLHVMNLGTRFGEGKMAFETTRLRSLTQHWGGKLIAVIAWN